MPKPHDKPTYLYRAELRGEGVIVVKYETTRGKVFLMFRRADEPNARWDRSSYGTTAFKTTPTEALAFLQERERENLRNAMARAGRCQAALASIETALKNPAVYA